MGAAVGGALDKVGHLVMQASAVAIGGRALALEGPPGSGKSSLALALMDRGALLIGDDAVHLSCEGGRMIAAPPPNIEGLIEVRGVGIVQRPVSPPVPLALILALGETVERLPARAGVRELLGVAIPVLGFDPGTITPALRAEIALDVHGLRVD